MLDRFDGAGGFTAMPKVVQGKPKYKDPYGHADKSNYYPQNLMHDRRVARGSTYAAMIVPGGLNPDAMFQSVKSTTKTKKRTVISSQLPQRKDIYPNRDIPSPEPVPGRSHMDVQTYNYVETLTDKPPAFEKGIATEFYLDRPPVPLFQPKMPSKENCKATQIYDEDPELFDFNKEIEPMLNVLVQRTLEQARMIVLEEEELRIISKQAKEYEELRNAELIEAQRLEAAELRRKQELERRKVQQKARKELRKEAHKKYVSRVLAKKHLAGLKDLALVALQDQGMLTSPIEIVLAEDVMPWLYQRMAHYINEDDAIEQCKETVVDDGIEMAQTQHFQAIQNEKQRKIDEVRRTEIQHEKKEKDKLIRRMQRQKKRKELENQKFKAEIKQQIIDKGEVKDQVLNYEIVDTFGTIQNQRLICGAIGGQLMQIYLVLQSMHNLYHKQQNHSLKRNPFELIQNPGLYHLMVGYLKEVKFEALNLFVVSEASALLDGGDLSKLTDDALTNLKDIITQKPGNSIFSHIQMYPEFQSLSNPTLFSNLMTVLVDLLSKKLPTDVVGIGSSKLEIVQQKVKFVTTDIPVDYQQKIAIVSLNSLQDEEKVLQVPWKCDKGEVFILSMHAQRAHRKDFVMNVIKKQFGEYFEEKDLTKETELILKKADELNTVLTSWFKGQTGLPLIEF